MNGKTPILPSPTHYHPYLGYILMGLVMFRMKHKTGLFKNALPNAKGSPAKVKYTRHEHLKISDADYAGDRGDKT